MTNSKCTILFSSSTHSETIKLETVKKKQNFATNYSLLVFLITLRREVIISNLPRPNLAFFSISIDKRKLNWSTCTLQFVFLLRDYFSPRLIRAIIFNHETPFIPLIKFSPNYLGITSILRLLGE